MSTTKWTIDLKSLSECYQIANKSYDTKNLTGLLFGDSKQKNVIRTVFIKIPSTAEEFEKELNYLQSFFLPPTEALGLVKLCDNEKAFNNIQFPKKEIISFLVNVCDLASISKNIQKIILKNPMFINKQNLMFKNPSNIDVLIKCKVNLNVDENILKNLTFKFNMCNESSVKKLNNFETLTKNLKNVESNFTIHLCNESIENELLEKKSHDNKDLLLNVDILFSQLNSNTTSTEFNNFFLQLIQRLKIQAKAILKKENEEIINLCAKSYELPDFNNLIVLVLPIKFNNYEANFCQQMHKILNVSTNFPIYLQFQTLTTNLDKSNRLMNPHRYINYTSIDNNVYALIRGRYEYYHYNQDNINDVGWGCAYRSFQTIWSWFFHKGFTSKSAPTHQEIQQCLVDIGDKKSNFVGSNEWIGSLELSYCLENMLGISARILSAKSSDLLTEHARAIIFHFENYGAPIMIGGGEYAYTILGISYDLRYGKCQFLVLDPHYNGAEDLNIILKNGWCAWKSMNFWNKKCFFNLLLPINS